MPRLFHLRLPARSTLQPLIIREGNRNLGHNGLPAPFVEWLNMLTKEEDWFRLLRVRLSSGLTC